MFPRNLVKFFGSSLRGGQLNSRHSDELYYIFCFALHMSQVTAEQIQSLVERIDHLERQLIDIRKFLQEKFTEGEDVYHKRKISSFQEEEKDGDVEEKKKSKTELVETSLFGFGTFHSSHRGEEGKILEKGRIFFFYHPRADIDTVSSLADVHRFYLLLCPGTLDKDSLKIADVTKRLIVVGRKQLPETAGERSRSWCSVVRATSDISAIDAALGPEEFTTSSGVRRLQAARPCGEGVYTLVQYPRHVHLAYVLELPVEVGEVQQSFNIDKEGSFIVAVKNPTSTPPPSFPSTSKPENFPPALLERFAGRAWLPATPEFLDVESAELLMIGASRNVEEDLGGIGAGLEELQKTMNSEKVVEELKLLRKVPQEPLKEGTWK